MVTKGDVIQVDGFDGWTGCLLIVDDVKDWGVLAYMTIPCKGEAYLRLLHGNYHVIGKAVLTL